jgi:nitroreductase
VAKDKFFFLQNKQHPAIETSFFINQQPFKKMYDYENYHCRKSNGWHSFYFALQDVYMNDDFSVLSAIIKKRRSTKPALFNGGKIPDEQIEQLLELADWAPTHTFSEPWRFVVYSGEKVNEFSKQHALIYQQFTAAEKFMQGKVDSIIANGEKSSHLIVCIMKRSNDKIPAMEETAAVACAVQNILLGAAALDIAALWSTGGMMLSLAMKNHFQLNEQDQIMGLLFLGKTNEQIEGKRKIALSEKVVWEK